MTAAPALPLLTNLVPTFMDRMKAETRSAHELTESIPFNTLLTSGGLALEQYVAQLACLLEVHDALERALSNSAHPCIIGVWRSDLAKAPLLRRDLEHFATGVAAARPSFRAIDATVRCVSDIEQLGATNEVALLGVLYVLEGSTLGGMILRKHLAAAFGLDQDGLAYYTPYGTQVMPHWQQFKSRMNAAVVDPADQRAIIDAACATFAHIRQILLALTA